MKELRNLSILFAVLVGNKIDLTEQRQVSRDESENLQFNKEFIISKHQPKTMKIYMNF